MDDTDEEFYQTDEEVLVYPLSKSRKIFGSKWSKSALDKKD